MIMSSKKSTSLQTEAQGSRATLEDELTVLVSLGFFFFKQNLSSCYHMIQQPHSFVFTQRK